MALSSLPIIALLVVGAALVIVRQFQNRPLRAPLLLGAPVGLLILGLRPLSSLHRSASLDALLVVNVAFALALGVWRGLSFRVWAAPDGERRRQGTRLTFVLWVASILARGGLTVMGRVAGAGKGASYQELPFMLGATLLAQAAVILWRARQLATSPAAT
jgi:hypothetical protein